MIENREVLYKEGCNAILHFSNCVMNVRTVTIAQGFAILTGAFFLIKERLYVHSLVATLFGFFFTAVLSKLHWNYLEFWKDTIKYVAELEYANHTSTETAGPWSLNLNNRERRLGVRLNRFLVERGPFALMLVALVGAFLYSLFKVLT